MLSRLDEQSTPPPVSLERLIQAIGTPSDGFASSAKPLGRLVRRWVPVPLLDNGKAFRRRWMILAVAACVVIVVAVSLWLTKKPQPEQPPELPIAQESVGKQTDSSRKPIGASAAGSAKTPSALVISVVGKVAKPGLVTVPVGSRVADALEAAGGVNPNTDVTMLNLARLLDDGEQLVVGIANPAQEPVSGDSSGENKKVDLNTATADQLDKLPGVGEVTVQRILQWRAQHGRFTKVEQLRDVDGIGESKFSKLRAQVVVR